MLVINPLCSTFSYCIVPKAQDNKTENTSRRRYSSTLLRCFERTECVSPQNPFCIYSVIFMFIIKINYKVLILLLLIGCNVSKQRDVSSPSVRTECSEDAFSCCGIL